MGTLLMWFNRSLELQSGPSGPWRTFTRTVPSVNFNRLAVRRQTIHFGHSGIVFRHAPKQLPANAGTLGIQAFNRLEKRSCLSDKAEWHSRLRRCIGASWTV